MKLPKLAGFMEGEQLMYDSSQLFGEGTSGSVYPGGGVQQICRGQAQFAVKVCLPCPQPLFKLMFCCGAADSSRCNLAVSSSFRVSLCLAELPSTPLSQAVATHLAAVLCCCDQHIGQSVLLFHTGGRQHPHRLGLHE